MPEIHAPLDYFKIASECCRKDSERIRREGPLPNIGYIPLARAAICLSCEAISILGPTCPACASESPRSLARWLFSTLKGSNT